MVWSIVTLLRSHVSVAMVVYYLATFLSVVKVSCTLLCPTDLIEWNNRADNLKCDNQKSEFYHCMLDSSSKLVEICMQHALIKPGAVGCPWVHFRRTTPILGYPLLNCNTSQCPDANHRGYYTDMLYLYPACFQQASNRTSYRTEKLASTNKDKKRENDRKANCDLNTRMVIIIVVAVLFALTILLLVTVIIWQRRKITSNSVKTCAVSLAEEEQKTLNS